MEVGIQYLEGLISEKELHEIREIAQKNELAFKEVDIGQKGPFAHAGEIVNFFFFLSPAILGAIASGVISNASYDALKIMIYKTSTAISGKKYSIVTRNGTTEKKAKFHLKGGRVNLHIEIPGNSTEAIEKAIEEMVDAYKDANK